MSESGGESHDMLALVAARVGVEFPAGTRCVGVREIEGRDSALMAKVELPGEALNAFLESLELEMADFSEAQRGYLGPNREWWDPRDQEGLPTAQRQLEAARVLNVGLACAGCPVVIVYIMTHET